MWHSHSDNVSMRYSMHHFIYSVYRAVKKGQTTVQILKVISCADDPSNDPNTQSKHTPSFHVSVDYTFSSRQTK